MKTLVKDIKGDVAKWGDYVHMDRYLNVTSPQVFQIVLNTIWINISVRGGWVLEINKLVVKFQCDLSYAESPCTLGQF